MAKQKLKPDAAPEPEPPPEKFAEGLEAFDAATPAPPDAPEPAPAPAPLIPNHKGPPAPAEPIPPATTPAVVVPLATPAPPKPRRAVVKVPQTHIPATEVEVPADARDPVSAAIAVVARKFGVTETAPGKFGFGAGPTVEFLD